MKKPNNNSPNDAASEYWSRTEKRLEAFDRTAPKWLRDGVNGDENNIEAASVLAKDISDSNA